MIDPRWLDRFGMVRTKESAGDSGNGILYSEIYCCLYREDWSATYYTLASIICGLWRDKTLWRNPENSYGVTSHDDWFAFAVMLLRTKHKGLAREVFWSCLIRGFMIYNKPFWSAPIKEKGDGLLWRFPHIWITMFAAAYPKKIVLRLCSAALRLVAKFSRTNVSNASGCQLLWLQMMAIKLMGEAAPMREFLARLTIPMSVIMSKLDDPYWQPGHIVLEGYAKFEREMLE